MGGIFSGGGGSHTTTKIEYRTDPKLQEQIRNLQQQLAKLSSELVHESALRLDAEYSEYILRSRRQYR